MENNSEKLFSRPLIIGASVSRGYGTTDGGPGKVVSKMINSGAIVTNKAMSGRTSLESTRNKDFLKTNPSIILAFDLFFWDAYREQTSELFESNIRKVFSEFHKNKIPMIIGRVPVGVKFPEALKEAGTKKSAGRINALLEEMCTLENNCILYDPKACFDQMGGPVSHDGRPYFSDSMHTTNEGNRFCAEVFVKSGIYRKLSAK